MIIGTFLVVFFQIGISTVGVGTSATNTCLQESILQSSYPNFETLIDTASNDSIISVPSTTVLSTIVSFKYYKNITVIGNSIVIIINGTGSVKFKSCDNVTIEGIIWERCDSDNNNFTNPVVEFYDSSNISIRKCTFSHSTRQVVVLSKVSGNVSIENCQFMHNNEYEGHGTAIHITQSENHGQLNIVIDKCNFTSNGPAGSVVYIDGIPTYNDLTVQNSAFISNEGVPIYISHVTVAFISIMVYYLRKIKPVLVGPFIAFLLQFYFIINLM